MHALTTTQFVPANDHQIDHWQATCSCGHKRGNSLGERWAARLIVEHAEYMNRKEAVA